MMLSVPGCQCRWHRGPAHSKGQHADTAADAFGIKTRHCSRTVVAGSTQWGVCFGALGCALHAVLSQCHAGVPGMLREHAAHWFLSLQARTALSAPHAAPHTIQRGTLPAARLPLIVRAAAYQAATEEPPSPVSFKPRVFADYSIYKGKGALSLKVILRAALVLAQGMTSEIGSHALHHRWPPLALCALPGHQARMERDWHCRHRAEQGGLHVFRVCTR
jgi:hypothetical protein